MSSNGNPATHDLLQRIEQLERTVENMYRGQLQASELQLVDHDGRLVASFAATQDGPSIQLYDTHGAPRAKLEVENDLPSLTLLDEAGKTRGWMGFSKDAIRVGFADDNGNNRAFFGVMKDSGAQVRFYDENQSTVWAVPEKE